MTFTETRDQLTNHSDFDLFKQIIFKNSELRNDNIYPSGGIRCSTNELNHTDNEYHVRVSKWGLMFDEKKIKQLQKRFDNLNSETKELTFEFTTTTDWDIEEGERTWDARIYFKVEGLS